LLDATDSVSVAAKLLEETNPQPRKGDAMRSIELKLEPAKVRITQEEILADLRYPARTPKRREKKASARGSR
jgi:hypothetical protein